MELFTIRENMFPNDYEIPVYDPLRHRHVDCISLTKLRESKLNYDDIKELNFANNRVIKLWKNSLPKNLQKINLQYNMIKKIDKNCFPVNLQELDLYNNLIINLMYCFFLLIY